MVLRLADALAMPKDAANQALGSAGFAPVFPALDASASELAPVRRATAAMIERHDPYPAFVIDRHWNVIDANKAAAFLFSHLALPADKPANLVDALIAAEPMGLIENWTETARLSLVRLRAEDTALGGDAVLRARIDVVEKLLRERGDQDEEIDLGRAVIPTVFRLGDMRLKVFSTIAAFSTVQDVNAGDIRIELMFPEDDATAAFFEEAGVQ